MNIPIITVTNQPDRAKPLVESARKHGWDIHVLEIEWRGFGTKLIETYEYLKQHPEIEQFVFCDGHDVVVLGTSGEFEGKLGTKDIILFSAEKWCWPDGSLAEQYVYSPYDFKYLNSGLYYSTSDIFCKIIEKYPIQYQDDDQLYFSKIYLENQRYYGNNQRLDIGQRFFNSHSFINENDYTYGDDKRIQVNHWKSLESGEPVCLRVEFPIFIHLNGGTVDEKLNQMLGI